jgi:hypothetical protein
MTIYRVDQIRELSLRLYGLIIPIDGDKRSQRMNTDKLNTYFDFFLDFMLVLITFRTTELFFLFR